jgi:hypothetical protein
MRNEYFRKVPLPGGTYEERILPEGSFAWRNVRACEYFRKVPFPSKNHRPVPGGTFELASTSERFLFRAKTIALCLEERSSLRVYFRKVPFPSNPSKNHRPAQARTTLCLLLSDHCLFGLHNRCGFKILTVILTV